MNLILLKLQFKLHCRQLSQWYEAFAYLLFSIIIFYLNIGSSSLPIKQAIAILLCLHLFTILLVVGDFLISEYKTTFLEQLYLNGIDLKLIIFVKYFSFTILLNIISLLLLPVNMLLLTIPLKYYPILALTICLFISLAILFTMLSALFTIQSKSKFSLSLITMLLILPTLLLSNISILQPIYIWLLVAKLLFFFPIFLLVAKYILALLFNQQAMPYDEQPLL